MGDGEIGAPLPAFKHAGERSLAEQRTDVPERTERYPGAREGEFADVLAAVGADMGSSQPVRDA